MLLILPVVILSLQVLILSPLKMRPLVSLLLLMLM